VAAREPEMRALIRNLGNMAKSVRVDGKSVDVVE
jgi:hypothetical protein